MIKKIQLPGTDCAFSALALGTVKFGRDQSVKYPQQFALPDDQQLETLLQHCIELGITSFDTAPAYGLAEQRLGKLLKGKRQQFEIISKAGESYSHSDDSSQYNFNPTFLIRQLEQSLKLLQTDYIDCWMLHSNGDDVNNLNDDVLHCLLDAKQSGKVRSVGLSGKTVAGGELALQYLDTLMMTRNLQYQEEDSLLVTAKTLHKKVFLKKIFNSGWIINQSAAQEKASLMNQTFQHCFSSEQVCSAIIGTINPLHLHDNVQALPASMTQ